MSKPLITALGVLPTLLQIAENKVLSTQAGIDNKESPPMEIASIDIAKSKDATISYKNEFKEIVEYRVFNFASGGKWIIGVCHYKGDESQNYQYFPIENVEQKYEIEEITLTTKLDCSLTIEYPSFANIRVIDLRSKIC